MVATTPIGGRDLRIRLFPLAAGCFVLLLGARLACAQSAPQAPEPQNWASECTAAARSDPLDCSVSQRLIDSSSGRLIAMVRIRVPSDTRVPVMLVQMPLGIYLPAGLTLSVDAAGPVKGEFQTCDLNGCYAGMPLADNLLKSMLKGQVLKLTVQDGAHKDVAVPFSLIGLGKAFDQIK